MSSPDTAELRDLAGCLTAIPADLSHGTVQVLGLVYRLTELANPPMSRKPPPSCSDESTESQDPSERHARATRGAGLAGPASSRRSSTL